MNINNSFRNLPPNLQKAFGLLIEELNDEKDFGATINTLIAKGENASEHEEVLIRVAVQTGNIYRETPKVGYPIELPFPVAYEKLVEAIQETTNASNKAYIACGANSFHIPPHFLALSDHLKGLLQIQLDRLRGGVFPAVPVVTTGYLSEPDGRHGQVVEVRR